MPPPAHRVAGSSPAYSVTVATRDDDFSEYFAARAHALRTTAFLLCGDWHRAEDITQVAMTKLYLAWRRLDRHGVDAYARTIVVRTFLAENRRLWRKREHLTHEPPERPVGAGDDAEQRMLVQAALASVPPRQRAVLVLRYWNDMSVEETAAALGCSTGTVKSQAARGVEALRRRLGPHFDVLETGGR